VGFLSYLIVMGRLESK